MAYRARISSTLGRPRCRPRSPSARPSRRRPRRRPRPRQPRPRARRRSRAGRRQREARLYGLPTSVTGSSSTRWTCSARQRPPARARRPSARGRLPRSRSGGDRDAATGTSRSARPAVRPHSPRSHPGRQQGAFDHRRIDVVAAAMMRSLALPTSETKPSSSTEPRSPVSSQPSRSLPRPSSTNLSATRPTTYPGKTVGRGWRGRRSRPPGDRPRCRRRAPRSPSCAGTASADRPPLAVIAHEVANARTGPLGEAVALEQRHAVAASKSRRTPEGNADAPTIATRRLEMSASTGHRASTA